MELLNWSMSRWFLSIFAFNLAMEVCKSWAISRLFSCMISPSLESIPAKADKVISFCTPLSVTTGFSGSTNWEFSLSISTECSGSSFECFSLSVSTDVSVLTHSDYPHFPFLWQFCGQQIHSRFLRKKMWTKWHYPFLSSYRYARLSNMRVK